MNDLTRRGFIGLGASAAAMALLAGCSAGSGGAAIYSASKSASNVSSGSSAVSPAVSTGTALRFATGTEAGTYYAFGKNIAQHIAGATGVDVRALVSNGSAASIADLEDGIADLAFCQMDVMSYARDNDGRWPELGTGDSADAFSAVAALYDEQMQIVTANPDITSVADLKGRSVSVGAAGSGVYFNALDVLAAYDLNEADITPAYESFGDAASSVKEGRVDAAFIVAGAPTPALTDLFASKAAYLIPLDDEHVEKLMESSPFYKKVSIPAGTYAEQRADVATVAVDAVMVVRNAVDEDDVHRFTAGLFDNAESLVDVYAKYAELSLERAVSLTGVPYHPGAARFFEEKGKTVGERKAADD